jgi:DivIVA domain-containing protein
VPLERESIEKKDFPVGRRGYEPAAVDAHLQAIAAEVEELKRSNRQRTETLAGTASDHVKAIIDAAETSGAEIRRHAEEEARELRADANRDAKREREEAARAAQTEREQAASEAQRKRDEASAQSREHLRRVSESTSQMLKRLEAMEGELQTLTESLRAGAGRLTAELAQVESEMSELSSFEGSGSVTAVSTAEVEPSIAAEPLPELALEEESETAVVQEAPVDDAERRAEAEAAAEAEPSVEPPPPADEEAPAEGPEGEDAEGARLIALNMALNGTPREETDKYLEENFQIPDRGKLLDEVYASVEG